jgi:hypothetical protein
VERQRGEPFARASEERIVADHESAGLQCGQGCEDRIDVALGACMQDVELQAQRAGRRLEMFRHDIAAGKGWVDERGQGARLGEQLMQELESLPIQLHVQRGHACEVATRSIEACSEADLNWIGASDENNGNRGCCSFGRCRRLAVRGNHGHPTTNQIGRQCAAAVD